MTALVWAFDVLLALSVVGVAWASLASRDGFKAIVLFIVFGLLVAIVWARLRAPDVALAEAAIGAGLTGALLLKTLRYLGGMAAPLPPMQRFHRWMLIPAVSAIAGVLGATLAWQSQQAPSLADAVLANLDRTGVANPVTAVLLNFRAYDTLLEVVVLLVAVVSVWMTGSAPERSPRIAATPVLLAYARLAMPLMVVVAGYLLWRGGFAPGGAFQAGAVLAAVLVLLMVFGLYDPAWTRSLWIRMALVIGAAVFLGAAILAAALGRHLLEYPPEQAKSWILVIEAFLTLSIPVILAALYYGTTPGQTSPPPVKQVLAREERPAREAVHEEEAVP